MDLLASGPGSAGDGLIGCAGCFAACRPCIPGRRTGRFEFGVAGVDVGWPALEPVAFAFERNDFGLLEEAVEYGGGAWDVTDEFPPVFERSVAGHDGAAGLMSAHDDLEEVFAAAFWELLHAHVIDDEQIRLEVACERGVVLFNGFLV